MRKNFLQRVVPLFAVAMWCAEPARTRGAEVITNAVVPNAPHAPAVAVTVTNAPVAGVTNAAVVANTNAVATAPAIANGIAVAPTNTNTPAPTLDSTNASALTPPATNTPVTEPAPAPSFDSNRSGKSSRRESAPLPSSPSNARIDFSTFKILSERNIFDPNRTGRSGRSSAPPSEAPPPRSYTPSVVEAFSLVGTLAYAESQVAFVDGASSQFKKALRLNDTLAGLKLKSVGASHATFDNEGAEIVLRVGQQLRREDRRAWQVNTQPTSYASAPLAASTASATNSTNTTVTADGSVTSTNAPAATTAAAPAEPPPTPAMSEALRRLLEKRKKEEEQ